VQDLWTFRDEAIGDIDLVGFSVEGTDGAIGKVDEASHDVGACCLVVEIGTFRRHKALLPAGLVERIDPEAEKVFVSTTKDALKDAPEWDPISLRDKDFRTRIGAYYVDLPTYRGSRV
jgi:hypothetical protein